jgi:hypothetical protein
MVTLPDGSDHLIYRPADKKVITGKEHEGEPVDTVEENASGGYFVVTQRHKTLVAPHSTFIHLIVVFQKEPSEKRAFEVMVAELKKAVSKETRQVTISAFAEVGPRNDPAGRTDLMGSNGRAMSVDFDPKSPDVLTTSAGSVERLK